MTSETVSATKPIFTLKEKRKFNWLVLTLLIVTIATAATSLIQTLL